MKIICWNPNGIRAVNRNINMDQFITMHEPDILIWTETKLPKDADKVCSEWEKGEVLEYGFRRYNVGRPGYASTAVWSKLEPIKLQYGIPRCRTKEIREDAEGRVITMHFKTWVLVGVYTPNSGQGLKRLEFRTKTWDPAFRRYIVRLNKRYRGRVMVVGDLNCANEPIDLHAPEKNKKTAGYTDQERVGFKALLSEAGLTDVWRERNPDTVQYSYWSYRTRARSRNAGWRIDYCLVGEGLKEYVNDVVILDQQTGSDHAPIMVDMRGQD